MTPHDPDQLLTPIAQIPLRRALAHSLILHLLLILLTSFGLYRAWLRWGLTSDQGFNTPARIKTLEKQAQKAENEAKLKALEAEKLKTQSAAAPQSASPDKPAQAPQTKPSPAPKPDTKPDLPLERETATPPKTFQLDAIDL